MANSISKLKLLKKWLICDAVRIVIVNMFYNKRVQECNPEPAKILFKGKSYSVDNSNTLESAISFSDYESSPSSSSLSSMLGKSKTRGSLPL